MQTWIDFYRPFFTKEEDVNKFVSECERLGPPKNTAKILMHQTQRLVSLADDLESIRPHDEPLKVLFFLMSAENVAKLHDGFTAEGQSRTYVRRFFCDFLSPTDKSTLGNGFLDIENRMEPLGFDRVVDMLYDIRCDVVHEGNYVSFAFHDGCTPMVNTSPRVEAHLQLSDVRSVIVRGCIAAVQSKLAAP